MAVEYSLQSYFDVGTSYGLGDEVFNLNEAANSDDILKVGLRNPLGLGLKCAVHDKYPDIIQIWRNSASAHTDHPEAELGYNKEHGVGSENNQAFLHFKARLRDLIKSHPINGCLLTIYALGTVFIRLDFASGLANDVVLGFAKCFEFGAYRPEVSNALLDAARKTSHDAVFRVHGSSSSGRRKWKLKNTTIQNLSKRSDPHFETDEKGYVESRLFSSFTHVAMCVDTRDDVSQIRHLLQPTIQGSKEPESVPICFEYHGVLYFNWTTCVIEPKTFDNTDDSPKEQILRMLVCIQIALTFHGVCHSFQRLFLHETLKQVASFVGEGTDVRDHMDLNRLRTLALAVVRLTNFALVTQTEEDQAYFSRYEQCAQLGKIREQINKDAEILLNVQMAEAADNVAKRETFLNVVALFLAGFALLSVTVDSFGFVRDSSQMSINPDRMGVLVFSITFICAILVLLIARIRRSRKRPRRRGKATLG